MRPIRNRTRLAALGASATAAIALSMTLAPAAGASAASASGTPTLNGDWAPFNRCPVTNSAMIGADGVKTIDVCVSSDSPVSSVKLGSTTLTGGDNNIQFGLVGTFSSGFKVVSPPGGAISAAPVSIPGGLLGLMCPSSLPVISAICAEVTNSPLNAVTATIESAGSPSHFNFTAGITKGIPIMSVPIKIQLSNPILGTDCFIGTNSDPIVLRPENLVQPKVKTEFFKGNGTPDTSGPMYSIYDTGGTQGDSTFAVPGASGCGGLLSLLIDPIVNLKEGLPSASGSNNLVLEKAATYLGGLYNPAAAAPNAGKVLAADWNSAIQNP
jgi:hypothetical protein